MEVRLCSQLKASMMRKNTVVAAIISRRLLTASMSLPAKGRQVTAPI